MFTNFFKKTLASVMLILLSPLFLLMYFAVKLTSKGAFIFKQKRAGKNKKPFILYKVRTMVEDAEKRKSKLLKLNEADGPVFKIRHDPRYTKVGKFLSHSGLDEIPQLINIIKGEMDFVGPRPLPVKEANKIPIKYKGRFDVEPGMTSPWIVEGAHKLSFDEWMDLDLEYAKTKNIWGDVMVFARTVFVIIKLVKNKIVNYDR